MSEDTLKINRNSWAYRLYNIFFYGDEPNNLCQYVNGLILAFIGVIVVVVCAPIWCPVMWFFRGCNYLIKPSKKYINKTSIPNKFNTMMSYMTLPASLLVGGGWFVFMLCLIVNDPNSADSFAELLFVTIFLGGFVGFIFGLLAFVTIISRFPYGPGQENDLFWEWVLAKKRKICPLIEMVSE